MLGVFKENIYIYIESYTLHKYRFSFSSSRGDRNRETMKGKVILPWELSSEPQPAGRKVSGRRQGNGGLRAMCWEQERRWWWWAGSWRSVCVCVCVCVWGWREAGLGRDFFRVHVEWTEIEIGAGKPTSVLQITARRPSPERTPAAGRPGRRRSPVSWYLRAQEGRGLLCRCFTMNRASEHWHTMPPAGSHRTS